MKIIAKLITEQELTNQEVLLNRSGDMVNVMSLDGKKLGYLANKLSSASKFVLGSEVAKQIGSEKASGKLTRSGKTYTVTVEVADKETVVYVVGSGNKAVYPAKAAPTKPLNEAIKKLRADAEAKRQAAAEAKAKRAANAAKLALEAEEADAKVKGIGKDGIIPLEVAWSASTIIFMYDGNACCTVAKATDSVYVTGKDEAEKNGINVIDDAALKALLGNDLEKNAPKLKVSIAGQLSNYSWLLRVSMPNEQNVPEVMGSSFDADELLDGVDETDRVAIEARLSWLNKVAPDLPDSILGAFLRRLSAHTGISSFNPTFVDGKEGYVERSVTAILLGMNLRLVGPAGCGKNRLVETLQNLFDVEMSDMAFNADTNQDSLLGVPTVSPDREEIDSEAVNKLFNEFLKGIREDGMADGTDWMPLLDAIRGNPAVVKFQLSDMMEKAQRPSLLNFDEVNMAPGYITALLHPLTDHRRYINIPGYGKVDLNDEAFVVCTMNEEYEGTKTLNRAFRDRFKTIRFTPSQSIASILRHEQPKLSVADAKVMDAVYSKMQKAVGATMQEESLSLRSFIRAAEFRVGGWSLKKALIEGVVEDVDDNDDREAVRNFVDLLVK